MSREFTTEEVRRQFLEHVWHLIEYWEKEERAIGARDKMEGLAFSILTTLDGESAVLPSFVVAPHPCTEDRAYYEECGENWYPENDDSKINGDIGGALHEYFHDVGREMGSLKD